MRTILMHSLPILVLGSLVLSIYYLSSRLAWAFGLSRWVMMLVVGLLSAGAFVSMIAIMRNNYTSPLSHFISNTSNIIIGVLMFAVCITMLVDFANLFIKMQAPTFGFIIVSLTLLVSAYSLFNASHTRVYNVNITLPNLNTPLRIAHVSDTHFGHFWGEKKAGEIASLIKAENVDVIVITGDMFDGRVRLNSEVIKPFTTLGVPVYFSEGNHDSYSGSDDIKQLLKENGITVLSNEKVDFKGLQIIGLDYLTPDTQSTDNFHGSRSRLTMQSVLPTLGIDPTRASLLLHHNPVGADYAAVNGINLYLAGHTHAGQLFPATIVAGWMFEYNKGLYKYNDSLQIYVTQGTGTFGPPMRLGTHSELTILNLN